MGSVSTSGGPRAFQLDNQGDTMGWIASFYRSALGKKAVMAATGIVLFGFVLGHMAGNLKLYLGRYAEGPHAGQYAIDVYGEFLREMGAPLFPHSMLLWIVRLVLLACVVLHVWAATVLTLQSWAARPIGYQNRESIQSTYAARTMRWGGVIILLFVLYHLAHLTFGWVHPSFQAGSVYANVVGGFQVWWVSAFYILANLALGLHLYHGLWSLWQTLGWTNSRVAGPRRQLAAVFAVLITAGNVSFPVAVLTGFVR